jgi:hypothetical protein
MCSSQSGAATGAHFHDESVGLRRGKHPAHEGCADLHELRMAFTNDAA